MSFENRLPPPTQAAFFNDTEREIARHRHEQSLAAAAEKFEEMLRDELRAAWPGSDSEFKKLYPTLREQRLIQITMQNAERRKYDRLNMLMSALDSGTTSAPRDPRDLGLSDEGLKS